MRECAQMVSELDDKMLSLNEAIQECLREKNAHTEQKMKMDDVTENLIGSKREQNTLTMYS